MDFLQNFYRMSKSLFGIFTHKSLRYTHPLIGVISMEIAYLVGGLALWAALALMVLGFTKLEKPQGERP
jgi:hypothetical protein